MKPFSQFLILTVLIGICSWLFSYILPWWIFTVVCFLGGLIAHRIGGISFFAGFAGVGSYFVISTFLQSKVDNFAFADKIGTILGASLSGEITGFSLLCIGALLFGILGGLFTLSGSLILATEPVDRLGKSRVRNKEKSLKLDLKRYNR